MGCSIINIKVVNCQIQVTDTCAKDQICYFDKVLKASKNRIWFSMGGLICSYDVRSIAIPNFATGTEIADLLNTQLEECRNLVTVDMPPVEPVKEIVETITVVDPDNPKKTITLFLFKNPTCVTTDIEGTNIVNLNDYEMNNTELGNLIAGSVLVPNEIPFYSDGITICPDGSVQDIVALVKGSTLYTDFVTAMTAKFPLVDGAAYGLSKISIKQFSGEPKRKVYCDIAEAEVIVDQNTQIKTVGIGNTSFLTVGGRKSYGRDLKLVEVLLPDGSCVNCYDVACQLVDGDLTAEGLVGNAVHIDFCIACFITPV